MISALISDPSLPPPGVCRSKRHRKSFSLVVINPEPSNQPPDSNFFYTYVSTLLALQDADISKIN
jgi:hypothetical protein